MKKLFLLLLIMFSQMITVNAQQIQTANASPITNPAGTKKTINKTQLPKAVKDSYKKTNNNAPIKIVTVYHYYWDNQAQYYDFHGYEDTLRDYAQEPLAPEYYELEYTKDHQDYKSVYAKDGTFMHTSRIIKDHELPEAVANAFKKSEYKDWDIIGDKEKINKKNPEQDIYKIKVQKGMDTHVLRYYPDGKRVK